MSTIDRLLSLFRSFFSWSKFPPSLLFDRMTMEDAHIDACTVSYFHFDGFLWRLYYRHTFTLAVMSYQIASFGSTFSRYKEKKVKFIFYYYYEQ